MAEEKNNIRNFCIIAHIDHGKSTLADRLLEITGTVDKRKMSEQYLDSMDLEKERGITIKLQPVRMMYKTEVQSSKFKVQSCNFKNESNPEERDAKTFNFELYILNLIDTPGHVDFNYEVSRSLAAVEGAILLVDATQGIQAQTLSNLYLAMEQELVIIPVINKIDLPTANVEQVEKDIVKLLGCESSSILKISAKSGLGVDKVLEAVIREIPPPANNDAKPLRALIFDSYYDTFKGVIAYVKIVDGEVSAGDEILMMASGAKSEVLETGIFIPELKKKDNLTSGEIGWIATGLKAIEKCRAGDTIASLKFKVKSEKLRNEELLSKEPDGEVKPLLGYKEPKPVVYASFYPTEGDDYFYLKEALSKLKLTDAAFTFEPESSSVLGKGFRCGFLGLLHLEIMAERIKREYNINFILTSPSVIYKIKRRNSEKGELEEIFSASHLPLPEVIAEMHEPWARVDVITPADYIGKVMTLMESIRGVYVKTDYINDAQVIIQYEAPLANIITDLHDNLKSVSSGFASMSYDIIGWRRGDLVRLDILVGGDKVEAFSRIVVEKSAMEIGRAMAAKLKEAIPRSQFVIPIQAAIGGKIIARETINPYRKDVTKKLYGGDVTRKNKLLDKQKKGKKKMKNMGRVEIPQSVFIEIMKK
ncbi:translation elongation factor 4 [Patescibacteria group bacterium]|nr:translation elongation factor 4 [Patescibacteria group bacterium]MBU4579700.1 translation elongation factor 4 [Patescibacteria group bacterium]